MPKTEIVYARLELEPYYDAFRLMDARYEINERLYEVLREEFYTEPLTKRLAELHPEIFDGWAAYRKNVSNPRPAPIKAVGKFEVKDQKVELLDIRFN